MRSLHTYKKIIIDSKMSLSTLSKLIYHHFDQHFLVIIEQTSINSINFVELVWIISNKFKIDCNEKKEEEELMKKVISANPFWRWAIEYCVAYQQLNEINNFQSFAGRHWATNIGKTEIIFLCMISKFPLEIKGEGPKKSYRHIKLKPSFGVTMKHLLDRTYAADASHLCRECSI